MESERERAILGRSERVLHLVAVAPGILSRDDRLELEVLQPPDPAQGVVDEPVLQLQLALVAQWLPEGPGARLTVVVAALRYPVGARLEHLGHARVRVIALRAQCLGPDQLTGVRAVHEHDIT